MKFLVLAAALTAVPLAQAEESSTMSSPAPNQLEHIVSPDDPTTNEIDGSPLFLALFGDSVSMATMADAKLGNPGPRFYADFIGSVAAAAAYDATIGKLKPNRSEDEQHQLLTALFGNMARLYLSPYLGNQNYSLPVLIKQTTGYAPKVYNGARMAGAYHFGHLYLDKFEDFFRRRPFHKKPEIIIVNFNGMDFMENWPLDSYAKSVRDFYTRLTAIAPHAKIVATGIADPVPLLTHPDRVTVPHAPGGPITCSKLYEIVRFGNKTGVYPGAPDSQLDAARARVAAMNNILENEMRLLNHDQQVFPQFKGQAIFVAPMADDGQGADHIAADCIHPDKTVQEAIGHRMWSVISPLL